MSPEYTENVPLLVRPSLHRYKPKYRLKWIKNKGAVLVVSWSFLVFGLFHFMILGSKAIVRAGHTDTSQSPTAIILLALTVLFPICGWLADAGHLRKRKMIRYSMWIVWSGMLTIILWYILSEFVCGEYLPNGVKLAVPVVLYVLMTIGLVGFQANIIQLGIDQLTDSSSIEITSFITSYVFTLFASGVVFQLVNSCYMYSTTHHIELSRGHNLLVMLYIAICLTLAICLDCVFGYCLVEENVPRTTNTVFLIAKVVKYVLVNRNRSDFERMSVFDIAKHQFGGPYQNYLVDQVKTFLRMTLVIAIGAFASSQIIIFAYAQGELQLRFHDWSSHGCYKQIGISYSDYICGAIIVLLYELVIYPLFNRCLPSLSTLNVFLIGIFLSILRIFAFLGVEISAYLDHPTTTHDNDTLPLTKSCHHNDHPYIQFSSLWIIVIGSMEGIYSLLFLLSGFEFMWAHAPSTMKGLIFGTMYALFGLSVLLQTAISSPFFFLHTSWQSLPLSCGVWYFLLQLAIAFVVLGVFILMIKRYKKGQQKQVRLDPVSIDDNSEYG